MDSSGLYKNIFNKTLTKKVFTITFFFVSLHWRFILNGLQKACLDKGTTKTVYKKLVYQKRISYKNFPIL